MLVPVRSILLTDFIWCMRCQLLQSLRALLMLCQRCSCSCITLLAVSCHDAAPFRSDATVLWTFHWLGDVLVPGWILEGLLHLASCLSLLRPFGLWELLMHADMASFLTMCVSAFRTWVPSPV
jgi:hypothetical protein